MAGPGLLPTEILNPENPPFGNDNDKTIRDALRSTYSRGILAGSLLAITSTTTLDSRYTSFFFDTTGGAITATLQPANYWGANKSPILLFHFVTGTNNVTITAAGSDTIDGATTKTLNSHTGDILLYTDGISKWSSFNVPSPLTAVPTVVQDNWYLPFNEGTTTISTVWADLMLNNTNTTTSSSFVTAVNYAAGSGVLSLVLLSELTHAGAVGSNGGCRITIDGTVIISNSSAISHQSQIAAVVAGGFTANAAGELVVSESLGIPFNSSCKIEIVSDGTRTIHVGWKIIKKT